MAALATVLFSEWQVSGGCTAAQPLGRAASGDYSRDWLPTPPATGPLQTSQTGHMRVSADLTVNSTGEIFTQRERPWTGSWGYQDGRPAPPMKGQLRRKAEREKFARRVVLLSQEMDTGLQAWQLRQQKLQEEQRKKENALKSKGASLKSPLPSQ
ncbi:large ribosomal subunit protein mL52 isoform X1 [Macaca fascicularis]|nr:39S ribosomal protein L52, mitochondrial isoform X1 [Macaca mulatta]XP_045252082.1 39S ribosomal protein L52, mitochondrial isoform X1 [Macaca fascicularis]